MATLSNQLSKTRTRSELVETLSTEKPEDKIVGTHVFGNMYGLDPKVINDKKLLENALKKAVSVAKMTLVEAKAWQFGGKKGGVSVIALITESHMALHTWNEYNYATLDIYTCGGNANPQAAFDYLVQVMKPKRHQVFYADRSMQ